MHNLQEFVDHYEKARELTRCGLCKKSSTSPVLLECCDSVCCLDCAKKEVRHNRKCALCYKVWGSKTLEVNNFIEALSMYMSELEMKIVKANEPCDSASKDSESLGSQILSTDIVASDGIENMRPKRKYTKSLNYTIQYEPPKKRFASKRFSDSVLDEMQDPKCTLKRNIKRNKKGETPLHFAVKKANTLLLVETLKTATDVNCKDYADLTPLHVACRNGMTDAVQLLLSAGADPNIHGSNGNTPLHDAAKHDDPQICTILLQNGADKTIKNGDGQLPSDISTCSEVQRLFEENLENNVSSHIPTCQSICVQNMNSFINSHPKRIMLVDSGLNSEEKIRYRNYVDKLQLSTVDGMPKNHSYLITSVDSQGQCLRTQKYIYALAFGIPVLSFSWLEECIKLNFDESSANAELYNSQKSSCKKRRNFLNENLKLAELSDHFVRGCKSSNSPDSVLRSYENNQTRNPKLFEGLSFSLKGNFPTSSSWPKKKDLLELIGICGGKIAKRNDHSTGSSQNLPTSKRFFHAPDDSVWNSSLDEFAIELNCSDSGSSVNSSAGEDSSVFIQTLSFSQQSGLKTLSISYRWVIDSITNFNLQPPNLYMTN